MPDPVVVLAAVTDEEVRACGNDSSSACLVVFRWTGNEVVARAADWMVARPFRILLILLIAWLANRAVQRVIRRFVDQLERASVSRGLGAGDAASLALSGPLGERAHRRAETIALVLRSLSKTAIWVIAALMIMSELNLNLGPLLAGAGIVGVAVGFGSQALVKDFLSGMFMLIEDQFGVGDVIDAGEASGVVEGISLRTTRLRDVEGVVWHIPNGEIRRVGNQSQDWSRALLDVQVAHGTDLDRAQAVIKRVADELWNESEWSTVILAEPEVWGVEQLAAAGITIRLVVKTKPADQWKVQRTLRRRINDAFTAAGIQVPGVQLPTPPVPGPDPGR
jgi:small conductance mechanosensitive channel